MLDDEISLCRQQWCTLLVESPLSNCGALFCPNAEMAR